MAYYENVFITRQDISTTQVEELIETFTKVIEDNHGTILKTENWGLRTLAYRIKKNRKGHYVMFNIDSPGVAIHEMERQMRISEDVIRYLTIKLDEFEEGPSAMMSSRTRDDRSQNYEHDYSNQTEATSAPDASDFTSKENEVMAPEPANEQGENNIEGITT